MNLLALAQTGFPFHPSRQPIGNLGMHRLRIALRDEQFQRHPYLKRLGAKMVLAMMWPVFAAISATRYGIEHGASPTRVLDAWYLALRSNVPPLEYFLYRLWEPERRSRLDDYLYWTENALALVTLNRAAGQKSATSPVDDKLLFYNFCLDHMLPTPTVFGAWELGSQTFGGPLPKQDLWIKPARGSGASGAERWTWTGNCYWRDGQFLSTDQMIDHVASHSKAYTTTLVQEVIHSHADQAPLIGDAPLGVRIITGRRRSGKVEVIDALAIWPRKGAETPEGGHVATINIASGCVGPVYKAEKDGLARGMEGQVLPAWPLVLDCVLEGHAKLGGHVFLGWDVAVGAEGPEVLETNAIWGCFHHQVVPDRPIADTAFASIAAEYV